MILLLWMNKKSDWIDLLQTFRGFSVFFFGNLLVWILIGVAFLMGILSRSYITQYNIHIVLNVLKNLFLFYDCETQKQ